MPKNPELAAGGCVERDGCPPAELLATYVDGKVTPPERLAIQQHLLTCRDCRDVVVDAASGFDQTSHVLQWRGWWTLIGAAAAAALVLGVWLTRLSPSPERSSADAEVRRELVAALAAEPARAVEGRLTGGFEYGPPPSALRGNETAIPPDVRIATARLQKRAAGTPSIEVNAALGVASLVTGDLDAAVERLEETVRRAPSSASYQSDLAAAYIARARWRGRADDWPRALAAAERAIAQDGRLPEPYFNRALAMEALHLDAEARKAWQDYLELDSSSGWSREAADRLRRLQPRSGDRPLIDQPPNRQSAREQIEDVLLAEWASAWTDGRQPDADRSLAEASRRARDLADAGGDAMPRAAVGLIEAAAARADRAALRALAAGHLAFRDARRLFLADNVAAAAVAMERAAPHFGLASSPYRWWGPVYRSIAARLMGDAAKALDELRQVPLDALPPDYAHLRGRYHWSRATALDTLGRIDVARREFADATALFERAGELEHFTATTVFVAEADWLLGDPTAAWQRTLTALANLPRLPVATRRNAVLLFSAYFALGEGLPEAALHFENVLIDSLVEAGTSAGRGDAYIQRARTLGRLGRSADALKDLDCAQGFVAAVEDRALRERLLARVRMARVELDADRDPRRALEDVKAALAYLRVTHQGTNLPQWLLLSARTSHRLGDVDAAHQALHAAADAFERARGRLTAAHERMQAFQEERAALTELVAFEWQTRRDAAEALRAAERSRASSGATPGITDAAVAAMTSGRGIPADAAVIYFVTCMDRVLTWVVTSHDGARFVGEQPAGEIAALVDDLARAVEQRGSLHDIASPATRLYETLVAPAIAQASAGRLVFVPDGRLAAVPFAVLMDREGRPLLDRFTVAVAPSLSSFVAASARLASFAADDVRAFGDGHDPRRSGLPRLPLADAEAEQVGELYPKATVLTGRDANRDALLATRERVIHFAGHAVVNWRFPLFSRLLLAPDANGDDRAAVFGADLLGRRFDRTGVIVLASCDTAAGPFVEGEGVLSLARLFVDTGIPAAIASLWPLDERAHPVLIDFHRELRQGREPAAALRAAQQLALRRSATLPVQIWGGLTSVGGLSPTVH